MIMDVMPEPLHAIDIANVILRGKFSLDTQYEIYIFGLDHKYRISSGRCKYKVMISSGGGGGAGVCVDCKRVFIGQV